jgi:hypothetical protein
MHWYNTINGIDLALLFCAAGFAYFWWIGRTSVLRQSNEKLRCDLHLALCQRDRETKKLRQAELEISALKMGLQLVVRERDGEKQTVSTLMSLLRSNKGGLEALRNFAQRVEHDRDDLAERIRRGVI